MPAIDPDPAPLFQAVEGGVRVHLRVQPKASRNRIDGLAARPEGGAVLRLRVTAPPEAGKANAAVIKLLAKAWGVPKSGLEIASGAADRNKTLLIHGDPATLVPRLRAWLLKLESA